MMQGAQDDKPLTERRPRAAFSSGVSITQGNERQEAVDDRGGLEGLEWEYAILKSVSNSPMRDDLDRCLDDLDRLLPTALATLAVSGTSLAVEMSHRREIILAALSSGYEI